MACFFGGGGEGDDVDSWFMPLYRGGPGKIVPVSSQTSLLDTILCVCAPHELPAGVKTQDVPFHFAVEDDHAALITVRYYVLPASACTFVYI